MDGKKTIAIVLCGFFINVTPGYAFFPSSDIVENTTSIFPTVKKYKELYEQINNQYKEMKQNLKVLGNSVNNISGFADNLEGGLGNVSAPISLALKKVQDTNQENIIITQQLGIDLNKSTEEHKDTVNNLSDNEIKLGLSNPKNQKIQLKTTTVCMNDLKENQKQILEQMNDRFNWSINKLNSNQREKHNVLNDINNNISLSKNISSENKKVLQNRVTNLTERLVAFNDKNIKLLEIKQEQYNQYVNQNVLNGINNYENTVDQYKLGNANIDAVKQAELTLKQETENNSVILTTEEQNSIKSEENEIKKEMKELAVQVNNMDKITKN